MTELPATLDGMLQLIEQRAPQSRIEMGLERVHQVRDRLDLRFDDTRIVSVAGTNGKGSTVAFLEAIACSAGLDAMAFTSPHLTSFGERFRFNRVALGDNQIVSALQTVERARRDTPLTWFEYVTLAGFVLASRLRPDWLIAEVGMGGRLDAVNAVDADAAVITSIGMDHQRFLGRTRAAIAREKCGIARTGRPAIVAEKRPPAGMLDTLQGIGAQVQLAGVDFDWRWRTGQLKMHIAERGFPAVSPGLTGRHQGGNATAAACAALALDPALPDRVIVDGIAGARLAGRFDRVARAPDIIVDVAHNPAAARVLAAALERLPGEKIAVFAALEDKDIAGMVRPLARVFQRWFVATLEGPRGLPASDLVARMRAPAAGCRPDALESVADALAAARQACRPDQTIVVFGSFMTAAAALRALQQRKSD